ncbi:glycoside hydrolase family 43 protein [Xanthomonas sp. AmX2]|uniref:glycoside hydrolase family 43 protein n=1 Tax=Xanthomonas sp. TaxID=29446 RepID=UPI0019812393|nr:glycoside hydrolase family 43 protein [Xanthomonas sp.]MBN6150568.1 glycoside hydrolase family 43 protein [Xanthomonas sp.]
MSLCVAAVAAAQAQAQGTVAFDRFEYRGDDAVFATPLPPGHYRNPVLAGFYPDPSVARAGDRYYLVNSTFAYFPAIPVFESADLVHWRQVGNVVERRDQLDFDGLRVSRGMFAASIAHHGGRFYVVGTAVDSGGNFIASADDPAGPWSPLDWLPSVDGIDPSLFFDDDGSAYLLNNGPPKGEPLYEGHRAIWMQRFDLQRRQPVGPRKVLVNGGVDLASKPIWIEGPHLYKRDGWYYLSCAEGGTGPQHSQVVLRSRAPWGPYAPAPHNPILTQRDLPPARADPVSNAGHADLVEGPDGRWWALFLASRPYAGERYNTGRETFLLPVAWRDGWPSILPAGEPIPYVASGPAGLRAAAAQAPMSGNFDWRDEFDAPALDRRWLFLRVPKRDWWDLRARPGWLTLAPDASGLDGDGNPAFLAHRQQHTRFEASTVLAPPGDAAISAGLAAFQNADAWYTLGVRRDGGRMQVFVDKRAGAATRTVARRTIDTAPTLRLKIAGDGGRYGFAFDAGDGRGWQWLLRDDDAGMLSTALAGGFVGATIGPYARREPDRSTKE